MKKVVFILCLALSLMSCSSSNFEAKVNGTNVLGDVKSTWLKKTEYLSGGSNKTAMNIFVIRNFEYDANTKGSALFDNEKLAEKGQTRVQFTVYDEPGSDKKTPLKVGTYPSGTANNKTLGVCGIIQQGDGKDEMNITWFGQSTDKGEVKITSVTDDEVSGEVECTGKSNNKDIYVKGKFTAKIYKEKS
jgi:hypothetical protein